MGVSSACVCTPVRLSPPIQVLSGIKGSHMLVSVGVALHTLLNSILLTVNNVKLLFIRVSLAVQRRRGYN